MEYAILTLMMLALVSVFCVLVPGQIKNVLIAGTLTAPLGPISEMWFLSDYWRRPTVLGIPISVEDVLFSFAIGALSVCLPYYLMRIPLDLRWAYLKERRSLVAAAVVIACMLLGTTVGNVNSIIMSIIGFWLVIAYAIVRFKGARTMFIVGGCVTAAYFFAIYTILEALFPGVLSSWCLACNPSGINVGIINIEEIVWDFSWGAVAAIIPITFFEGAVGNESAGPSTSRLQKN